MGKARPRRSRCPIAFSLDLFGDRWSLLILRDIAFGSRHYYREFLRSGEGIATNVLADRLARLEGAGILNKARDRHDRKQFRYTLTDKGLALVPVLLEMIVWGADHDPSTAISKSHVDRIRKDRDAVIEEIRRRHREG